MLSHSSYLRFGLQDHSKPELQEPAPESNFCEFDYETQEKYELQIESELELLEEPEAEPDDELKADPELQERDMNEFVNLYSSWVENIQRLD
ncbi:hypothetical protein F8M41_004830 [Gigaspora margarita]|uniref:Uncharacterized protein n=1 Tax=Gigaspora margarita TaxID=4874 RepID=A0A8H4A7C3_GIGMA|nr:hypothetical protein F8M41_004830 [Gigaspora margarita]